MSPRPTGIAALSAAMALLPVSTRAAAVLVFDDTTSPSTAFTACAAAGHTCTLVDTTAEFAGALNGGGFEVVVVDTASLYFGDSGGEAALLDALDAGTPIVLHSFDMESHASFFNNFGVAVGNAQSSVREVYQQTTTLFTTPNSVPSNVSGVNRNGMNCVEVDPHSSDASAYRVAVYDTISSTDGAATVSQSQQVVVFGFSSDEYAAQDDDHDGVSDMQELYENAIHVVTSCSPDDGDGDGFSPCDGDCDDTSFSISPDAIEIPGDTIDQDCDGSDGSDADADGHASVETGGDDCDDGDGAVHPGATELANALDDDCDGTADEGTALFDDDGDGYCEGPEPCTDATAAGDCDDGSDTVHPGAAESCHDQVDNDCDGSTDDADTDCGGTGDDDTAGDDDTSGTGGPPPTVGGCQCDAARVDRAVSGAAVLLLLLAAAGSVRRRA